MKTIALLCLAAVAAGAEENPLQKALDYQLLRRIQAELKLVEQARRDVDAQERALAEEQNALVERLCVAAGVPQEKIRQECSIQLGEQTFEVVRVESTATKRVE